MTDNSYWLLNIMIKRTLEIALHFINSLSCWAVERTQKLLSKEERIRAVDTVPPQYLAVQDNSTKIQTTYNTNYCPPKPNIDRWVHEEVRTIIFWICGKGDYQRKHFTGVEQSSNHQRTIPNRNMWPDLKKTLRMGSARDSRNARF